MARNEKNTIGLLLEVEELESRGRPGGCFTSSTTSPLCTCPCRWPAEGETSGK